MRVYRSIVRNIEPSHVDDGYWSSERQSLTVIEDRDAKDTGLVDHRGHPIYSVNETKPIGFNRD